ncbi:MAG: hypothetical protein E3J78_05075 [Candidatus Cloacimonadota bacterium]|nr:MAG: hypothetical protein E3J78_05075 [Candidatus Cloacimonadota bacterium]
MMIRIQNTLNSSLSLLTMLLFSALYLVFAKLKKDSNFILGGAIAFSISYYFMLSLLPDIFSSKQLLFFNVISVLYVAIGFGISKRKSEIAQSLYSASVLIALVSSFSALFVHGIQGGTIIIIISALTFSLLMFLTRRNEYMYLISLSLGFLAFHLLQVSGSEFVKELVDYFFYALLFLGIIFIFLFFKKKFEFKAPFSFLIITGGKGRLLMWLPIILLVALVFFVLYPLKVTMNPIFCGSCHNMGTAIETWENSVHGEIDCGKCHYLPGIKGFVKTKLGGLAEVASFTSGKYGKKILHHPELADKTCLRCHVREELFDAEIEYNDELPFDHESHLEENPFEINLTCTSCHAQVNPETHFEINESTCLICHNLDIEDFDFNEISVRKQICDACHVAGMVDFGEGIHDIHVKGQKARCVACHLLVQEEKNDSE